jgi:phosphohistidine phosphatase
MAPQLWFLRHGEAVPHDSKPDEARELTPVGERQAAAAGQALARLGVEFTACYTSPKVRARDTAKLACESLGVAPEEAGSVGGEFARDDALELLLAHDDEDARVLVVGHEPSLSQVVHDLTGARVDLKKGGLAAVRVARGSGELISLMRPKDLESLARG